MNSRKWRNPYSPLAKKTSQAAAVPTAAASLSLTPKNTLVAMDLRSSVSRMRNNIKGISSTIRQMEATMDTLYGAMEMVESLSRNANKSTAIPQTNNGVRHSQQEAIEVDSEPESPAGGSNPLANIDMSQLLSLLQSPLVQSLLSQHAGGAGKRKKEG
jgi:hypothetical protein